MALARTVTFEPLSALHPDPRNPRLPDREDEWADDDALLKHLADNFEAIELAESIARHDYFGSEPLVITREQDRWLVLEGNRRLAALQGLARPELRATFREPEQWDAVAELVPNERPITEAMEVPVLVAEGRADADALIGFRHIAGVQQWAPLQRARFIAHLVDDQGEDFDDVSDTVGEEEAVVRMLYRNQGILSFATAEGHEDIAQKGAARFGTFTAALNRRGLREFVGAVAPSEVAERTPQLDEAHLGAVVELSSWLYGDEEDQKVIEDTRDLTRLAEVVRTPEALDELRRTRDLGAAYALTPGPPRRLVHQLAMAVGNLRSVANSAELIAGDERAAELAEELKELTERVIRDFDSGPADLND